MFGPEAINNGSSFRALIYNAAQVGNLRRLKIFLDAPRSEEWYNSCLNCKTNEKIPLVVAARYGYLECVKYLISKGASVHVRGAVSFDGELISEAPALWAAAAAGHMNVVQCLVESGADINQTTGTNSTPLRGACYDGHLNVVEFLVEHGANIEIANRHGHTPLMIAAFRCKEQVVDYLLSQGADATKSSAKGNTALHDAAEADNYTICQKLLRYGATLKKDDSGLCPLMCSAMIGNETVIPILMEHCSSGVIKREAYKMLGCTRVDKRMDLAGAVDAWKKSLEMYLTVDEADEVDELMNKFEPAKIYTGYREARTVEELYAIAECPITMKVQALLVRERILGGGHPDVHYYLRFRGAVFCDLGQPEKCYDLWMHALQLQQKHLHPLHCSVMLTFTNFHEQFVTFLNEQIESGQIRVNPSLNPERIISIFNCLLNELDRVEVYECSDNMVCDIDALREYYHRDDPHQHDLEKEKKRLVLIGLQLIQLMNRIMLWRQHMDLALQDDYSTPVNEHIDDGLDVKRFIGVTNKLSLPILHYALEESDASESARFPSYCVIERLLRAGVNVDFLTERRTTPLHVLIFNPQARPSIAKLLLEYGASITARNDDNLTCLQSINQTYPDESVNQLMLGNYVTLAGLAAVAVKRNHIPFEKIVPIDLQRLLLMH